MTLNNKEIPIEETIPYVCHKTTVPIRIDGMLDEVPWELAKKSPRFVDMVSGEPGFYDTQAAVLWDDQNLYIGFWIEEPFVKARLTERDSLIFQENDVEVFIDGGDCYYEFEINALGTIYEVFFIWQDAYQRGGFIKEACFDILQNQALSFGGDSDREARFFWTGTHPRGLRWAFRNWDFPGLKSAVSVQGKINDNSVVDKGWTVELAFPWQGMKRLANGRSLPPREGDIWKIFFGRFQLLKAGGNEIEPHPAWVWSPHGIYDTHQPERFTQIRFTEKLVEKIF
jgi:hypothetical protein